MPDEAESDESEQIHGRVRQAFVIKQGEEGTPVTEICRKAGISQATYFNWKKKYAGLLPTEMKRLKQLEDESGRLNKIVADLTLDREMLQDGSIVQVIRPERHLLLSIPNRNVGIGTDFELALAGKAENLGRRRRRRCQFDKFFCAKATLADHGVEHCKRRCKSRPR